MDEEIWLRFGLVERDDERSRLFASRTPSKPSSSVARLVESERLVDFFDNFCSEVTLRFKVGIEFLDNFDLESDFEELVVEETGDSLDVDLDDPRSSRLIRASAELLKVFFNLLENRRLGFSMRCDGFFGVRLLFTWEDCEVCSVEGEGHGEAEGDADGDTVCLLDEAGLGVGGF